MKSTFSRASILLAACLFMAPSWSDEIVADTAFDKVGDGQISGLPREADDLTSAIIDAASATIAGEVQAQREPPSDVAMFWVYAYNSDL